MGQEAQIRRLAGARKSKNAPPILSHEFVIQNHGDIFSCILVVFLAGFMWQVTAPIASMFIVPQYNTTYEDGAPPTYTHGRKDLATVFFYTIGAIVAHAILQEYVLDKLQRKLHLSKTKTSKFTESGHLFAFSAYAVGHAFYIIRKEKYAVDLTLLWADYPYGHRDMSLLMKLYFLIQIAYWLHQLPSFYLTKVKREDAKTRSVYTFLYLIFTTGAYVLNFTRFAVCLLTVHYACEAFYHLTRMVHFAERPALSTPAFKVYNILFVGVRLFTIAAAFVTFWYGMRASEVPVVDIVEGNFDTPLIRIGTLAATCLIQVYFMWNFIMFHLKQMRERKQAQNAANARARYGQKSKAARASKADRKLEKAVRDLPEAEQAEHTRVLRSAKKTQ